MAVSQEDIVARIRQIQEAGGGDTAATRAEIAREAQQYGVGAGQIAGALQSIGGSQTEADVRSMAREAGAAFAPRTPTGGMLSGGGGATTASMTGGSTNVFAPTSPFQVSQMLSSGQIDNNQAQKLLDISVADPATLTKPEDEESSVFNDLLGGAKEGNLLDFSQLLYGASQSGVNLAGLRPYVEDISQSAKGGDRTASYNYLVGSVAGAQLIDDMQKAVASGDIAKVNEITSLADKNDAEIWSYYTQNYPEGSAHELTQQLGYPFDIGPPGMFNESGINAIVDPIKDTAKYFLKNPEELAKAAAMAYVGNLGGVMGTVAQGYQLLNDPKSFVIGQILPGIDEKLTGYVAESFENPFVESVARGTVKGALQEATGGNFWKGFVPELSNFEEAVPAEVVAGLSKFDDAVVQPIFDTIAEVGSTIDDEAIQPVLTALKPYVDSNTLDSEIVDQAVQAIKDVGDFVADAVSPLKEGAIVVGDVIADTAAPVGDVITDVGDVITDVGDDVANLFDGVSISGDVPQMVTMQELQGPSFRAQRGYQPGLAVDLEFDRPGGSAVLDILNQPSSVRRA